MSVQTEITRLESAKAAIKAAIEGKGVTVPDATLLDGMAALIESIEAGGGIDATYGSITVANPQTYVTVDHGMGKRPSLIILFRYPDGVTTTPEIMDAISISSYNYGVRNIRQNSSTSNVFKEDAHSVEDVQGYWNSTSNSSSTYKIIQQVNDTSFKIHAVLTKHTIGYTYVWVAFANDLVV